MRAFAVGVAAVFIVWSPARAQDAATIWNDVSRTFTKYCVECHGDYEQRQGKYRDRPPKGFTFVLDLERMLKEETKEKKGRFVVPGAPDRSEIYTRIRVDDMPYGADEYSAEPVPDSEKDVIRRWIEALGR